MSHDSTNSQALYKDLRAPIEERVTDLLARMTLEEKITMMSGAPKAGYTGYIPPNDRLGIPALTLSDGPVGVKSSPHGQPVATLFPAPIALAASWDPDLVEKIGAALGSECRANGVYVLLAPCVNILRVPLGGRSFEAFGEDPYLTARMTVAYIKGVQSQKVMATVKHFAANNQEWQRFGSDSRLDERTLREIYLPAFRSAVQEAEVWSVMGAYNRVNGTYACENPHLLTDILKDEWGFAGFVVSDWFATHSTAPAANAGLDLEMPGGLFFTGRLREAVRQSQVSEAMIDGAVRRILRAMFAIGLLDGELTDAGGRNPAEHMSIALEVAREGIVLLKNQGGVLPLDRNKIRSLALIGPYAAVAKAQGGGSAHVPAIRAVSPLEALARKAGGAMAVYYAQGDQPVDNTWNPIDSSALRPPQATWQGNPSGQGYGLLGEYFANKELKGDPVVTRIDGTIRADAPAPLRPEDGFSVRWTGALTPPVAGTYEFAIASDDGMRLYLDGRLLIDNWRDYGDPLVVQAVELEASRSYDLRVEYYCHGASREIGGNAIAGLGWKIPNSEASNDAIARAAQIAKEADVAVVFVADHETEGRDRDTLALPGRQDELIEAVASANQNTVVVLQSGAPVLMHRWIHKVPAVAEAWYLGQEAGTAVAEILLGEENPSGKLPVTFPAAWEDSPASGQGRYPGEKEVVEYSEGLFVGYRHFDKEGIEPLFPFGHGLSYTTFQYSNLEIINNLGISGNLAIRLKLQNAGEREGAEVVQLYIRDVEASVARPDRELKGFQRVALAPGESKLVTFQLGQDALAFYDPGKRQWVVEPGQFEAMIGSSSRDIRLIGRFTVGV